ncbi:protoporphyrinogen oxidase [Panicum miliaceum]|uniref:Protoporphyrinogen oxidase n=1 Tax=Panicum miliaceum TaxID=4540 RepID=A0A3L6T8H0_PANMI|nr:protoporphyrinogen oxidase [Panicum miliaceum]
MHVHAPHLLPATPKPRCHAAALRFTVAASAAAPSAAARKAVIVGGGLAGLAAATHVTSLSVPFTLVEASDRLGGRVATDVIFLTAYPECRRLLDLPALRLRPFYPGALVFTGAGEPFYLLSDPFRLPLRSLSAVFSPVGTLADKVLVGLTRLRAAVAPDDAILSAPETTTARHLQQLGFSPSIVERFLRPFLAGIFFDPALDTSSRLFELVFKRLALGDNALPEGGIGARRSSRTASLLAQSASTPAPPPSTDKPKKSERSTVCLYFSTDRALVQDPILLLNGSGKGIVKNMFFATNVAPSYAPPGKVLVSVSLVGSFADGEDADLADEVVRELGGWFGAGEVASWTHLRTYRIGFAQPDQTPPTTPARRDPRVGDGLYVCGDHWCSATFDGALVSGRRAAEALAKDRGLST